MKAGLALCLLNVCACSSQATDASPGAADRAATHQALGEPPVVGREIGTDPPVAVAANAGYNTELASDGNGFLTVETIGSSIRGSRIDANGNPLDLEWIDFGPGSNPSDDPWAVNQYYPTVTFGGGHYLVIWSEYGGEAQNNERRGLRGRLVNPDGTLVGTQSIEVGGGPNAMDGSAAWDGQHFVVTWSDIDASGKYNIFSGLLNADGSRVPGSEHAISTRGNANSPHIAHASNQTFVAWQEYITGPEGFTIGYAIYGSRLSETGVALDPGGLELSGASSSELGPDVAISGSDILVVFQTYESPASVRGSLVSHAGQVTSRDFAISHSTGEAGLPSVTFDGTNYLVAWSDARDEQGNGVYGVKVAPGGAPLATTDVKLAAAAPRSVSSGSDHTNVAWNGSRYLVTFLADLLQGGLLEQDLTWVDGDIPLTAVANKQGYPRIVFNGQSYVVAWTDERDSSTDMAVRAVRIDSQGQLLDPQGIAVSPPENPAFSLDVASIGDGSTMFMWSGSEDPPKQRFLSSAGSLGPIATLGNERLSSVPTLASDGAGFLSVFSTWDSSNPHIYGDIRNAAGVSTAQFEISPSTANTGPVPFRGESGYWVAYSSSGMWLAPVSSSGQVGTSLELTPRLSWLTGTGGKTNALVAWTELDSPIIRARFLKAGSFSGEPIEITNQSLGYAPAAAWDGSTYWLVWETEQHHLAGRSLSEDGTLGEISTWVNGDCAGPMLVSDGQGQMLLSYAKYANLSMSRRVHSRLVGRGAEATPIGGTGGAGGTSSTGGSGGVAGSNTAGAAGNVGTAGAGSGGVSTSGGGATATTGGAAGSTSTATGGGGSSSTAGGSSGSGGSSGAGFQCSVEQAGGASGSKSAGAVLGLALALTAARRRRTKI